MKQKQIIDLYLEIILMTVKEKSMTKIEVSRLFESKFVLEELIRNYELLKIYDIRESLKLTDDIVNSNNSVIRLYHGTDSLFENIDLKKSKGYNDFGPGFYCTVLEKQAKEWAIRQSKRNKRYQSKIYEYDFLIEQNLKIKRFSNIDVEWFDFVLKNRKSKDLNHNYDIVIGPIADDDVRETIRLFDRNIYTKEQAMEKLKYKKLSNQISFHTKNAHDYLRFIKRSEFNVK